jgi:hypothetical protein
MTYIHFGVNIEPLGRKVRHGKLAYNWVISSNHRIRSTGPLSSLVTVAVANQLVIC